MDKTQQDLQGIKEELIYKTRWVAVTTPGADVEFSVSHGFGVIPNGYLIISQDKAASIYKGTTAWTQEKIFLKCNVATVSIKLIVF